MVLDVIEIARGDDQTVLVDDDGVTVRHLDPKGVDGDDFVGRDAKDRDLTDSWSSPDCRI
jgi:hypothetical protein